MRRNIPPSETRTPKQLEESYKVERELAAKLRNSTQEERKKLYSSVYNDFFRLIPYDPLLTYKADSQAQRRRVVDQMTILLPDHSQG